MNAIPKPITSLEPGNLVIWINEYYYHKLLKAQTKYNKEAILFNEIRSSYRTQTDLIVSIKENTYGLYVITSIPLNDNHKSIQTTKSISNNDLYAIVL